MFGTIVRFVMYVVVAIFILGVLNGVIKSLIGLDIRAKITKKFKQ